jgi:hypothetical protein
VRPSSWANEVVAHALVAGNAVVGHYIARDDAPAFSRIKRAATRYERASGEVLGDAPYALIARVTGQPRVVVLAGRAVFGLEVEALGAMIGERLFIDATPGPDGECRFAGEPEARDVAYSLSTQQLG